MDQAKIYYDEEEYKKCLQFLQKFVKDHPSDKLLVAKAKAVIICCLVELKEFSKAEKLLYELQNDYPEYEDQGLLLYQKAYIYYKQNKLEPALEEFENYKIKFPEGKYIDKVLYFMSRIYFKLGNYDKSIDLAKVVIKSFPETKKFVDAKLQIAQALFRQKKYQSAISNYKEFIDNYGTSKFVDEAYISLGKIYLEKENYPKAKYYFRMLINNYPDSIWSKFANREIGYCYYHLHEYPSAIQYLEKYLKRIIQKERDCKALYYLASSYLEVGESKQAIPLLKESEKKCSGYLWSYLAHEKLKELGIKIVKSPSKFRTIYKSFLIWLTPRETLDGVNFTEVINNIRGMELDDLISFLKNNNNPLNIREAYAYYFVHLHSDQPKILMTILQYHFPYTIRAYAIMGYAQKVEDEKISVGVRDEESHKLKGKFANSVYLRDIESPELLEKFINILKNDYEKPNYRRLVLDVIEKEIGKNPSVDEAIIKTYYTTKSINIRAWLLDTISSSSFPKSEEAIELLIEAAKREKLQYQREIAIKGLAKCNNSQKVASALIEIFKLEKVPELKLMALKGIKAINKDTTDFLLSLLKKDDLPKEYREAVIHELGSKEENQGHPLKVRVKWKFYRTFPVF